jgi:hypothetical protein
MYKGSDKSEDISKKGIYIIPFLYKIIKITLTVKYIKIK